MVMQTVKAAVQIIVLAVLFYKFYISLAENRAAQLLRTVIIYAVLYLACRFLKLEVLEQMLRLLVLPACVFLCVLYQPELRRAFAPGFAKKNRLFRIRGEQTSAENVDSIISACQRLVQSKRGALIVFPRKVSIKNIIDSGTKVNADISSPLIVTVFDHDTPLHDGAMIIQGSKIVAAACYLPLSAQADIKQSFGTRHRAALGMAEESDAVVLVVSEETGAISLAYNGNLYYQLEPEVIKSTLLALFNNLDIQLDALGEGYETK